MHKENSFAVNEDTKTKKHEVLFRLCGSFIARQPFGFSSSGDLLVSS